MYLDEKSFTSPPVESKPDVYAPQTLIAWLETMPADENYELFFPRICLTGQYLQKMGIPEDILGRESCDLTLSNHFFREVAYGVPYTFGAALARARALLP